jgi:hypothetical protein
MENCNFHFFESDFVTLQSPITQTYPFGGVATIIGISLTNPPFRSSKPKMNREKRRWIMFSITRRSIRRTGRFRLGRLSALLRGE